MIRQLYSIKQKIIEYKRNIIVHNGVPVFMVHHVNNCNGCINDNLTISTDLFCDFFKKLIDSGIVFVSPDQLANSFGKQVCMITFDDVCKDALDNAVPFLEEHHISYVCFISPLFVEKKDYLSNYDLNKLKKSNLCTIGAHGINHKLFRFLGKEEKYYEISAREHKQLLGCDINDFAFPYGSVYACDNESKKIAQKEYARVYSTICAQTCQKDLFRTIPRINLNTEYVFKHGNDLV